MPTFVSRTPKELDARNKMAMDPKLDNTWNTGTLTPTSNREEVSWSSSDGSTYYSEGRPSVEELSSEDSTDYSEDEASLQQRRQTRREFEKKQQYNKVSYASKSYDANDYYERSRERKERTNDFRPRRGQRELPLMKQNRKKNLRLRDVDSFSAIESATGSEDVSTVGFLTTADTAQVFCTAGIPFEITANKKLYEKVSAISSTSSCDSSSQSSYSSDSESDDESRNYQDKDAKHSGSDTGRATIRSQKSAESSEYNSVPPADRHEVALVSVSHEEAVSSLECTSSLDESSLGSDTSAGSSVEKPRTRTRRKSPIRRKEVVAPRKSPVQRREVVTRKKSPARKREAVTTYHVDSKASRMKEIQRKKSDLKTDEKIRQLKEKIRRISDLSNTNITLTSSEVESHLSPHMQSQRIQVKKIDEYEEEGDDDNVETGEPLVVMSRFEARAAQQRNKPISKHNDYRRSFEADKSLVGTVIHPIEEKEEISILRFDTSARPLPEGDIEEGHLRVSVSKSQKKRTSLKSINEFRNSMSEHTKIVMTGIQYRAIAAYDHVLPIIARKRAEFLRKPRYEQILIIAIGSLFSLFLVLLFVMIAQ